MGVRKTRIDDKLQYHVNQSRNGCSITRLSVQKVNINILRYTNGDNIEILHMLPVLVIAKSNFHIYTLDRWQSKMLILSTNVDQK